MAQDHDINRYYRGPIYRVLSGLFGVFLIAIGIYAIFFGVVGVLMRVSLGLLITLLGTDALWSALRSKQAWITRLGPFI